MRSRAMLLTVAVLVQAGCYNYRPLRRSALAPSSYLAVTLTESGAEELAPYLGPNALVVRGRYLAATERGLAVSVESVESRRGDIMRWAGETVVVPFSRLRRAPIAAGRAGGTSFVILYQRRVASALDARQIADSADVGTAGVFDR